MGLNERLIADYYGLSKGAKSADEELYFLWNCFMKLVEREKAEADGLRQSIRRFIENHYEEAEQDLDFEALELDVFYERPVFEDLRVEDRDIYYYQDFNTNRSMRMNDDYSLSIRGFKRILEDSDLINIFMNIFKVYGAVVAADGIEGEYAKRLVAGSNYVLRCVLNVLMGE